VTTLPFCLHVSHFSRKFAGHFFFLNSNEFRARRNDRKKRRLSSLRPKFVLLDLPLVPSLVQPLGMLTAILIMFVSPLFLSLFPFVDGDACLQFFWRQIRLRLVPTL
jgi:hypothetical protein